MKHYKTLSHASLHYVVKFPGLTSAEYARRLRADFGFDRGSVVASFFVLTYNEVVTREPIKPSSGGVTYKYFAATWIYDDLPAINSLDLKRPPKKSAPTAPAPAPAAPPSPPPAETDGPCPDKPGKAECIAALHDVHRKLGGGFTRKFFIHHNLTKRRYEKLWPNWNAFVKAAGLPSLGNPPVYGKDLYYIDARGADPASLARIEAQIRAANASIKRRSLSPLGVVANLPPSPPKPRSWFRRFLQLFS